MMFIRPRLSTGVIAALAMSMTINGYAENSSDQVTPATHHTMTFGPVTVGTVAKKIVGRLNHDIQVAKQYFEQLESDVVNQLEKGHIDWKTISKIIKVIEKAIKIYQAFEQAATAPLPPIKPVEKWEYIQNLADKQYDKQTHQEWFWHTPQGTYFMPYKWFLALETPIAWKKYDHLDLEKLGDAISQYFFNSASSRTKPENTTVNPRFADPSYLARFGMLTTPKSAANPDGLPAGLTKQLDFINPSQPESRKQTVLGMSCALCHSGKLQYNNKTLYIDGAPAQTSLELFGAKFVVAFLQTLLPEITDSGLSFARFERFATNVYGHKPGIKEKVGLYFNLLNYAIQNAENRSSQPSTTTAGFFRLDALDQIGNQVFGVEVDKANMAPTTAPVSYPMIWTVPWFAWAEYPGVVRNPMIRNVGEALGVKAPVNLTTDDQDLLYQSTVMVDNLYRFEMLLMTNKIPEDIKEVPKQNPWEMLEKNKALPGLESPLWQKAVEKGILPPINQTKADAGKQLYQKLCQHCHLPPINDAAIAETDSSGNLNPAYWEAKNEQGYQFIKTPTFNITEIGTDPQTVINFAERFPDLSNMSWGPESGIKRNIATTNDKGTPKVGQTMTMADGLKYITQATANRWYKDHDITDPKTIERLNGYRANEVLLTPTYRARALDGIWATGPYLHNGSVANLYELLLPVEQRAKQFIVGEIEFDPVKVGFKSYEHDADKQVEKQKQGYFLFKVEDINKKTIIGNSNAGHEFKGDGKQLGNGIIGRSLSETERYQLIEYLKTL